MNLHSLGPEPSASANSATSAHIIVHFCRLVHITTSSMICQPLFAINLTNEEKYYNIKKKAQKERVMKKSKAIISAVSGIIGGILVAENIFLAKVINEAKKDYKDDLDYLFILGGLVIGEEAPGENLVNRIEKAAEYLISHPDTVAVACGGCFREGQKKSEALIIKERLVSKGIDADRILLEDKSTTTNENFRFGKKIVEAHSGKELYCLNTGFLSSDYHLFRAGIIAKINGLAGLKKIGARSPAKSFVKGALRELAVAPDLINNVINR